MEHDSSSDVSVEERSAQPTVAVRSRVPMAELDIGALFGEQLPRVKEAASRTAGGAAGPPYARYFEFGPERADIEIGVPVTSPRDLPELATSPSGELGLSQLPGGSCAVTRHLGDYDQLRGAYERLESWMQEEGRTPRGAPWESYLVMPDEAGQDPSALVTEICWPVPD